MSVLEIGVKEGSKLLERFGADVPALQKLRELTQNGIDAGARNIDWDIYGNWYKERGWKKLMVVDDGRGMEGEEMTQLINNFASSSNLISLEDNFGNGAKISTFLQNPEGTIYLSRKNGKNYQVLFEKDKSTGRWGLHKFEGDDGTYSYHIEVDDAEMPDRILEAGHGTAVIMLGKSPEDNTLLPIKHPEFNGSNQIIKELNSRYYRIPEHIKLRVNHFSASKGEVYSHGWVYIKGNGYFTERFSESSGSLELTNGKAHWFIIRRDQLGQKQTGIFVTRGHVGLLYQNELYGRRGSRMQQNFGLNFTSKRVVVYIEPDKALGAYPNSGRTDLLVNREPFPWDDFADEFRENMPDEIRLLENEMAEASTKKVDQSSINKNLRSIYDKFLKVSKYRESSDGTVRIQKVDEGMGGRGIKIGLRRKKQDKGNDKPARPGGATGNLYKMRQTKKGEPAIETQVLQLPEVIWVTVEDGSRSLNDDLEDRAASYSPRTKIIRANADFRVFKDTETQMQNKYEKNIGVEGLISTIVRKWYTQELKEVTLVTEQLRNTKMWVGPSVDKLTSPEALTCSVLTKFNILRQIQEEIESAISDSSIRIA